jgi:hypothetical protein
VTRRGRKPKGPELVTNLAGSDAARERLKRIVDSLTGRATVAEVCAELGIGESRFHQLRSDALQAALDRLEPRAAGRPTTPVSPADARVAELERQLRELQWQLQAYQIRLELAEALPGLVRREPAVKKTTRPSPSRPTRPSGAPETLR